jgi:2-polyprenyl-3-methyl-5-hydroxy-6-metoxy-1,4-benzoquinol methylase
MECRACETIPRVPIERLQSLYVEDYFAQREYWIEKCRLLASDYLVKVGPILDSLSSGRNFLEIGGGYGFFSHAVQLRHPHAAVKMIELNRDAAEFARQELHVNVAECPLESFKSDGATFDLIFAAHVVEHFVNMASFFDHCIPILRPGGRLICLLPNSDSVKFRMLKRSWGWACPDQHLQFLNPRSATALGKRYGIDIETITSFVPHPIHYPAATLRIASSGAGIVAATVMTLMPSSDPIARQKLARAIVGPVTRLFSPAARQFEGLAERILAGKLAHDELMIVFRRP